jgi:hypothetical protein
MKKVPLSDHDIRKATRGISHFRGVFMRDSLPQTVLPVECGVVNLDDSDGPGTHWVAYYKRGREAIYFDSYGLDPPRELVQYMRCSIQTQTFQLQGPKDVICGHLCIHVLHRLAAGDTFKDIVLKLVN